MSLILWTKGEKTINENENNTLCFGVCCRSSESTYNESINNSTEINSII